MFALSLPIILSTFAIIFIAELPDKTALAALILASKYGPRGVIVGTWLAFLVQTLVAVLVGGLVSTLPTEPIRIASGLGFLVFAVLALRRKEDEAQEKRDIAKAGSSRPVWLMSFLVIFAAEWGDLTQLATAALVARGGHPLSVGIGAVLALWTVTVIAAYSGHQIGKYLRPRILNIASAVLFGLIGLYMIAAVFLPL